MGMLLRRHRKDDNDGQAKKTNKQGHATKTQSKEKGKKKG